MEVGVTMYVLSISSLSEVQMVSINAGLVFVVCPVPGPTRTRANRAGPQAGRPRARV